MKLQRKLSPAVIDAAKPEATPYRLWDTAVPQLHLRVQPSGVKSWNVQWSRTVSKSLGKYPAVTVESARTRARDVLAEADRHGAPLAVLEAKKPKALTLRQFVSDHYAPWASANQKSGGSSANRVLTVFGAFADRKMTDLDAASLEKWRTDRLKGGVSKATCNRDIAALKSALSHARKWGMLDLDPIHAVKQSQADNSRVRYLSPAEEKRLRDALDKRDSELREARRRANDWRKDRGRDLLPKLDFGDHLTPAVLLSLNTGLRKGELLSLDWSDIDFHTNVLTVRAAAAKSGRSRRIPINAEAHKVLERWRKQAGNEGRLFPFKDLKTAWGSIVEAANLDNFRWHDLRHDFASKLVMAGVDLNTVRELMGHADIKMTLRYAHMAPGKLADAVAKIGMGVRK